MRGLLVRLAMRSPVPVFTAVGLGARSAIHDLRLCDELRFVDSTRPASVFLVAGELPPALLEAAVALHDTVAHPRVTVLWRLGSASATTLERFPHAVIVDDGDVVASVVRVHRELLAGNRASESALRPDVDPAPWRGVGPYGQGGTGMTGGVPYGRPMAERADDRDGLSLDQLPLRVGPFFPRFPPGLVLDVKLAGDLVQEASARENPFLDVRSGHVDPLMQPFLDALVRPTSVRVVELVRARSHLRWLADALDAHGLAGLARRALVLAAGLAPVRIDDVRALSRAVARTGVLTAWSTAGIGCVMANELAGTGAGPVARAAGLSEDARSDDPTYRDLGFEPVVHERGDARDRWRQRMAEIVQSLELASRAGDRSAWGNGVVESPRGRMEVGSASADRLVAVLPRLLAGNDWGDAVTTIVSLDLDLEESSLARSLLEKASR